MRYLGNKTRMLENINHVIIENKLQGVSKTIYVDVVDVKATVL